MILSDAKHDCFKDNVLEIMNWSVRINVPKMDDTVKYFINDGGMFVHEHG